MRQNYEMSDAQLSKLLAAMRAEPAIMLQCGPTSTLQERANTAWAALGAEMGFLPMTVQPAHGGQKFFSAEAIEEQ